MADAKIINYGQQISAGSTAIPDNTAVALDIESTDAKDYITIDTTDSGENIGLKQRVVITDKGGASGNIGQVMTSADSLVIDSADDSGMTILGDGNDPMKLHFVSDAIGDRSSIEAKAGGSSGNQYVSISTGGTERFKVNGSGQIETPSGLHTLGSFATTGGGTVGTGGSSDATLEQSGASTFQTALHVGAAIKIVDSGDGEVFLRTVASITDANTLEMDEAAVVENGSAWYHDSGELFAVKTGDSKTLLGVNGTGAIQVGSAAADSSVSNNIAIGDSTALNTITTGTRNFILGTSSDNYKLTTGYENVFIGYKAGEDYQTGNRSVAIGGGAGASNDNSHNAFIGYNAGNGATGNLNVSVGSQSMLNCTGSNSVAVGFDCLKAVGDADSCVALGAYSLSACTGDENIGVGQQSGDTIVGGTGNICIGHQADTGAAQAKSIAIGYQVAASVDQKAYIGDGSSATSIVFSGSGNSWSTASDSRIKENVEDNVLGLDFINALRPVKYTEINPQDWPEEIRPHIFFDKTKTRINEETGEEEEYIIPASERQPTCNDVFDGLIAQEVKTAADAAGTTFSGYEDSEPNGLVRLQYEKFVVPLIKAVQELTARVAELEAGD